MTETRLASIVRRDRDWDAEFTGVDWRAADILIDRRYLLRLLRDQLPLLRRTLGCLRAGHFDDAADDLDDWIQEFGSELGSTEPQIPPSTHESHNTAGIGTD